MSIVYHYRHSPRQTPGLSRNVIPTRVLIVSADTYRAQQWRAKLQLRRFAVTLVHPDRSVCSLVAGDSFEVIVLDLAGSSEAGLSLCRQFRAAGVRVPVLMLHPQGGHEDLLDAFEAGTDAYMCGQFEDAELLSRVGALSRRRTVDAIGDSRPQATAPPASH